VGVGRALQVTACGGRPGPGCHHGPPGSCKLFPGTVSERPKDHVSKTCVGATPPWVQIPPVPPQKTPVHSGVFLILDVPVVRIWCRSGSRRPVLRRRSLGRMHSRSSSEPVPESAQSVEYAGSPVQGSAPCSPVVSQIELATTSRCATPRSAQIRGDGPGRTLESQARSPRCP
jgi:hypothetical protein